MTDLEIPAAHPARDTRDGPADADPTDVEPTPDRARFPVQRAKAQRPPLRPDTLHRGRLLDWLAINIHHRLVLLVADAGYGKTTLLSDFAGQTRLRTIWFRVDDEDRDWISVLHYLVAAGREADPSFASATAERLAELGTAGGTREEIVRTFLGELARLGDEPTVLIVDDYHVLDESGDARSVIAEILVRAPERFTVVLATRRRPSLAIARLRALGEVAELTTDDLRFTEPETEALFRDAYHQPLEPDVLSDLARRTEGWAASLQLVRAAVRERSTVQIRAFVRALSGVDENLYDYLAEEVVGELEPGMQDFLMRTSILQVVDPALSEIVAGVPQPDARRLIESAERIGLLSRRGEIARHTVRYHPLVRDFLEDRLRRDIGDDAVADLHRTVARHGESTDWRLAAHHYAAAQDGGDVQRVLRESIGQLLGRGDVDAAHVYLLAFPQEGSDPVRAVIESRLDYLANRLGSAEAKARSAWEMLKSETGLLRDVALFQLVALQMDIGPVAGSIANAKLLIDTASSESIRSLARGVLITSETQGADLEEVVEYLEAMLEGQRRSEHWHFVAVTLANAAFVYRQIGEPSLARSRAEEALATFPADDRSPVVSSAQSALGWAMACVGEPGADERLSQAIAIEHSVTRVESLVEAADVNVWYGSAQRAEDLLGLAEALPDSRLREGDRLACVAELAVRTGDFARARSVLAPHVDTSIPSIGQTGRVRYVTALLRTRMQGPDAPESISAALEYCQSRHIGLFARPLEVLKAAATNNGERLSAAVVAASGHGTGALSMVAEILTDRLDQLDVAALNVVEAEACKRRQRWAAALRHVVEKRSSSAPRAASILDQVGERQDVALLRSFARAGRKMGVDPEIGRRLARRLAPPVLIEDLGRVRIFVGPDEILRSSVRKKSLALLCFLLTRVGWSATKEQALEALWPDADPDVAANSLNQTLYFLRRVFDPEYKEDVSAEYVHHEHDVIWLDGELVRSRSALATAALDDVSKEPTHERLERLITEYGAAFALDFEYEEWAGTYRDALHARFLEVVERTLGADTASGHFERAIWLARAALDVEPDADELEALLVRLYRLSGSHLAAAEQYEHYSRAIRTALGVDPPPIDSL